MDVVAAQLALIIVAFAVDVHQVELVDHPLPLKQMQGPVYRAAVDGGVDFLCLAQNLAGVEVLLGGFDDCENGPSLLGHADARGWPVALAGAREFRSEEEA